MKTLQTFAILVVFLASLSLGTPAKLSAQESARVQAQPESRQTASDGTNGPDASEDPNTIEQPILTKLYLNHAQSLRFEFADKALGEFRAPDQPVMTWTSLDGWSGAIFVWKANGRIQLAGCIGSQIKGDSLVLFQELQSFSRKDVRDVNLNDSESEQAAIWKLPATPPVVVNNIGAPSERKALRTVQMRQLARSFKVGMRVTESEVERELRLLPQPLARVTNDEDKVPEHGIYDSALFSFVSTKGTDPEAFLLVEARRRNGKTEWTYHPGRLTTREIWFSRNSEEVFRVSRLEGPDYHPPYEQSYLYRDARRLSVQDLSSSSIGID